MTIFQECIGLFLQAISTKNLNQLHFILTIHDASPSHSNLALEVSTYSKQMLQGCISRLVPVETPEFEFIHAFLLFFKEWGDKEKYTVLHKSFSQVYRSFMVWVTSTHEPWGLSLIKVLQKQLIDISKLADFECRNINLAGEEHIHATFELLNVTLQTLEEKGASYSLGLLLTYNSFFHLVWKVDQVRRDLIWETIYSKQIDTVPYPKAHRVPFHYHLGHRLLQLGLHGEAEPHLMQSLQLCPLWSTQNHLKLVCTFLLCRLFQGYVPPISWLQKYQLDGIFMEFIECLCQCNYVQADQWIVKHTAFLLKMGLFFILIDQLRYLMIRKCLRCCLSAYLYVSDPDLSKPRRMPLRYFASALDRMFQTLDQDATESLFSAYHKLTHLIAQGHARGYISLVHKIYVMPKTNDLKLIVAPIRAINT